MGWVSFKEGETKIEKKKLAERFPKLKDEIAQAVTIGNRVFISPAYTFFPTGNVGFSSYSFVKNKELVRVYTELVRGWGRARYDVDLLLVCRNNRTIRVHSPADLYQMRMAYDSFCPTVLTGLEGQELDAETLRLLRKKRMRTLKAAGIAVGLLFLCTAGAYALLMCWTT